MKSIQGILLVLSIIATFMLGIYFGAITMQNEYEKRSLELGKKDCYSIRDVKYILFKNK